MKSSRAFLQAEGECQSVAGWYGPKKGLNSYMRLLNVNGNFAYAAHVM